MAARHSAINLSFMANAALALDAIIETMDSTEQQRFGWLITCLAVETEPLQTPATASGNWWHTLVLQEHDWPEKYQANSAIGMCPVIVPAGTAGLACIAMFYIA